MQPKHQVIQEQFGIDRDGDIVVEHAAGPSAAPSKMEGIGTRNMMSHCTRRRLPHLYGEAHVAAFASATVNRSAAPKEHAPSDGGQGLPILFILHERVRASPAQVQMNDFSRCATHVTGAETRRAHTGRRAQSIDAPSKSPRGSMSNRVLPDRTSTSPPRRSTPPRRKTP